LLIFHNTWVGLQSINAHSSCFRKLLTSCCPPPSHLPAAIALYRSCLFLSL
jgi:hypothetical protein